LPHIQYNELDSELKEITVEIEGKRVVQEQLVGQLLEKNEYAQCDKVLLSIANSDQELYKHCMDGIYSQRVESLRIGIEAVQANDFVKLYVQLKSIE
jgi:hypothetical protein